MPRNFAELLKKTSHYDPDERYMAIRDIKAELEKDTKIDPNIERQIADAVLRRLSEDTSNDVQALAVRCLSTLLNRAQDAQLAVACQKLCDNMAKTDTAIRDIYSIGLKRLITDANPSMGPTIAAQVGPRMLETVKSASVDKELVLESMQVLSELLKRFGEHMTKHNAALMEAMMFQLHSAHDGVQKRAADCLAALAVSLADSLLSNAVERLLKEIRNNPKGPNVRRLIQTVGTISHKVGFRLGRHLAAIVPLFLTFMGSPDDEDLWTDEANEVRENCLHAFEAFVLRCPSEVAAFLPTILPVVKDFMTYDPNYNYDAEGDDDEDEDMSGSDDDYDDDDDYSYTSDSDDTSWKVRRASVRLVIAIVRTRPQMVRAIFAQFAELIIDMFKEREEEVKLEFIGAMTAFIRATLVADAGGAGSPSLTSRAVDMAYGGGVGAPPRLKRQTSNAAALEGLVPDIIKAAEKQLKSKAKQALKTKVALWTMLRELAVTVREFMSASGELASVLPHAEASLADSNAGLRLEAMHFLRVVLDTNPAEEFHSAVPTLVPAVVACAKDDWYKMVAETLRVAGRVACVLRPIDLDTGSLPAQDLDPAPYVKPLYNAVFPCLAENDIDQEIKECAITAAGLMLAHLGNLITAAETARMLPLFEERLHNEITRLPAIKALTVVAVSPLNVALTAILQPVVVQLQSFLRQQSRVLRQSTLSLLTALVSNYADKLDKATLAPVINEAAAMITDEDLHLCQLALQLCTAVVQKHPDAAALVSPRVRPNAVTLAVSPVLQTAALEALKQFFKAVVSANLPGCTFGPLLESLFKQAGASSAATGSSQRLALANAARCVAVLCENVSPAERAPVITQLMSTSAHASEDAQLLNLLSIGEVGFKLDVAATSPDVFKFLLAAFNGKNDHVKSAASFALGGVCVGSMESGLKVLLTELQDSGSGGPTYLLLSALKELLGHCASVEGSAAAAQFQSHTAPVTEILASHCESKEEGIRNMVAECLGKIAGLASAALVPRLATMTRSKSELVRWTAVTSLKYAVPSVITRAALGPVITDFFELLRDEDLDVRKAAMNALNATVHHDANLVRALLLPHDDIAAADDKASVKDTGVFPVLYFEMIPRKDLMREMDLGPFKHKVDTGLELRKGAFAVMDQLLDHAPERINPVEFLPQLCKGLEDHVDVQMQCHQLVSKMCTMPAWQLHVLGALGAITGCLDNVFRKKLDRKRGKGGGADGGVPDVVRSALRAVESLSRIPNGDSVSAFVTLLRRLEEREPTKSLLATIRAERAGGDGGSLAYSDAAAGGGGAGGGAGAGAGAGSF